MWRACLTFALATAVSQTAHSQTVISLHSGLLNYAEGLIATTDLAAGIPRPGAFHLRKGEQLRTDRGRAELLLAPTVFLRMGDESEVLMDKDVIDDVCITILSGTAVVDAVDVPKNTHFAIRLGQAVVELEQTGIYRFDAATGEVRVFDGRAAVTRGDSKVLVKKGKMLAMSQTAPVDFDRKFIDRVQHWSARRSVLVAQSNLQSARASYGPGWRRMARVWVWSLYQNAEAARATFVPLATGY